MPIYLVLALGFFDECGLKAAQIVLVLYAVTLGAEPYTIGLLAATFSLFPMMVAVPAGRLIDRFGARWLHMFGAGMAMLGMLIPYFFPGLPAVFLAAAMFGILDGIHVVSLQNLIGLLSTPDDRVRNFSNYSVATSISVSLGPLIAGFSIDHVGHVTACLYVALLAAMPAALLLTLGGSLPRGMRQVRAAGVKTLDMLALPGVRRVLVTAVMFQTGNTLYQFYLPVYANAAGLSATSIGIVLSMYAVALIAVRLVLPRMVARHGEANMLAFMFFVGGASLMMIPLFKEAWMLGVLAFVYGVGMGFGGPIINMVMFMNAPPGRSAEGIGLKSTLNHLTKMIAPVVFGTIGTFGFLPMFWTSAFVMGMGGIISRRTYV